MTDSPNPGEVARMCRHDGGKPCPPRTPHCDCELVDAARAAQGELERMRDRERHFTKVLDVADGGQYRNDWDTRITALIAERDAARADLRTVEDAHGKAETAAEAARADVDTLLGAITAYEEAVAKGDYFALAPLYDVANTIRERRA